MATSSPFDDSRLRSLERERERYEKERTHQHDGIEKLREVFERDTERLRERFKRELEREQRKLHTMDERVTNLDRQIKVRQQELQLEFERTAEDLRRQAATGDKHSRNKRSGGLW